MKIKKKGVLNLRKKIFNLDLNRLSIFKSNKYIYCQIVSNCGNILISVSSMDFIFKKYIFYNFGKNICLSICSFMGKCIAYKALKIGVKKIVFDRSGYKFHGCIKYISIYAKKFGLIF